MTGLRHLNLLTSYHKGINDIASEFYLPCIRQAIQYDRAVGFFSSTIYSLAWSALKDFVDRKGKIRIICSPVLSNEDIAALEEGYDARIGNRATNGLQNEVRQLLNSTTLQKPARVLASLVALNVIELRVAFVSAANLLDRERLFHDKLGIFTDSSGDAIAFKGSMNETWRGLSNDGNLESVDVFLSWESEREQSRVTNENTYFNLLWDNQYPSVTIKPFPEVAREELIQSSDNNWKDIVDEINAELENTREIAADKKQESRTPRPHQIKALLGWANNDRRGIFEHATGSGKTFTALCAIRESLGKNEIVVILVPSELLLAQWIKEIHETLNDLEPRLLICGGGHTEWRDECLLTPWTRHNLGGKPRIVISTLQTAATDEFRAQLQQGEHIFIIADEVHRIGSPENRKLLLLNTGARLGLSATPRRAGDAEGTKLIYEYFNGIIPPPFTLKDAIPSTLTPYFYYIHTIRLTSDEQDSWNEISSRISKLFAQKLASNSIDISLNRRIQILLIERARIVKAAKNKIPMALDIMLKNYTTGQRWILYCDSLAQLQNVVSILRSKGLPAVEYHSTMTGDRNQTIRIFESNGGIMVSIRCLDEGVDIPSVTHALILASSKNPREFIQRRGRVLRKAQNKHVAYIHDVLVLPNKADENKEGNSIIQSEIARAIEFGKWGENPASITDLEIIALKFGMNYQDIVNEGYEDDNN